MALLLEEIAHYATPYQKQEPCQPWSPGRQARHR